MKFQREKNNNQLRYNKNVEGVDSAPPPGSFRVKVCIKTKAPYALGLCEKNMDIISIFHDSEF